MLAVSQTCLLRRFDVSNILGVAVEVESRGSDVFAVHEYVGYRQAEEKGHEQKKG